MEEFLQSAWDAFVRFQSWQPPALVLYVTLAFSGVTAVWLSANLPGGRLIALPLCFAALLIAGLFANFIGSGVHLTEANDVQKSVVLALAGEVIMAIIILLIFRPERHTRV
jgi:hypothetical protein